jgi:predicted dehydrogenase
MVVSPKVRYAVVGLGWIAQESVLPAFANAPNSELTALVSDDPVKLRELGRRYGVRHLFSYDDYDAALESGAFDAVYIALPNDMHCDFTVRAARAGVHVLCEKPMAVTEAECRKMISACRATDTHLMIAYRLHFEAANLEAIRTARSGALGELRLFNSVFSMPVKDEGNIRLKAERGGGTLYDIGIYCINAARYTFQAEPTEVFGMAAHGSDRRFREVEESVSATLRFPGDRLASFTCSFGGERAALFQIVGTKGDLRVDPAYKHRGELRHLLTLDGKTHERTFPDRDQFAAELIYFSRCLHSADNVQPSGREGLADVRIIQALYRSIAQGGPVRLAPFEPFERPHPSREIHRPPAAKPRLVHAHSPAGD